MRVSQARTSGFHASGACDLHKAIKEDSAYQKKREGEKRLRVESLLAERLVEFQHAGYWKRQAILKAIHLQVNREFSLTHCLF